MAANGTSNTRFKPILMPGLQRFGVRGDWGLERSLLTVGRLCLCQEVIPYEEAGDTP